MAAVVTAVGTSFTGLQGTIIGALVGAMVGAIVSELTKRELSRLEARARARLVEARRRGLPDPNGLADTFHTALAALRARFSRRLLLTVGGIALGGLVVGIAMVSVIELLAGRPLSAIATGRADGGTTLGQLVAQAQSATPSAVRGPLLAEPSPQSAQLASPSPREAGVSPLPNPQPAASPVPRTSPAALSSPPAEATQSTAPVSPGQTPALIPSSVLIAGTTPLASQAPRPAATGGLFRLSTAVATAEILSATPSARAASEATSTPSPLALATPSP